MVLIKSISGIRGTLENIPGESLSDIDIIQFSLAYVHEVILKSKTKSVILGRDARKSGKRISKLVSNTLLNEGINVVDLGLVTMPTLGISVKNLQVSGGIMISASHNDEKWNALKLLSDQGEFLSPKMVEKIIDESTARKISKKVNKKGKYSIYEDALKDHVNLILSQEFLNIEKIRKKKFSVLVDGINSVGGTAIPNLLKKIGVDNIKKINCIPNGKFAHNPEPIPENIIRICDKIKKGKYDVGIVVDPDADRLCLIDEKGIPFGEEYTLVAAAEFVLSSSDSNNTCSNLSSSLALKVITEKHGGIYYTSAVGEINVVEKMKKENAIIGGEGNGGVIYPKTHYGRDSLIGIVLILSLLAERNIPLSALKKTLPQFSIVKKKLNFDGNIKNVLEFFKQEYLKCKITTIDGIRIDFHNSWVHVRKSNTEPVIRVIAEAVSLKEASRLAKEIMSKLQLI
ncbi:MAG: phosphoglucosamine mutase [Marinoscillum sp.]|jgi:phosphomannomutase